jgi:hypothetical protein
MAAVAAASAGIAKADPDFTAFLVPDAAATAAANSNPSDVSIHGQTVYVSQPGDKVVMDIYASIQQSDGNQADDGFYLYKPAFYSETSAVGGTQGIFNNGGSTSPNITYNTSVIYPATSQAGVEFDDTDPGVFTTGGDPLTNTAQQGDANGRANPGNDTLLQFSTGLDPTWGDGSNQNTIPSTVISSTNPTQFLLGTITWTATSVAPALDAVQILAQPGLGGGSAANQIVAYYYSDATSVGQRSGYPPSVGLYKEMGTATNLLSGPPVVIVPEPTSLGIVAMGISILGVRVRRRMPC